jgi:uncharacterized paraquat-inducible protein A
MLENFGLAVAALLVISGAAFLISGITTSPNADATVSLFGGAAAFAAGVILAVLTARSKLHWRRIQKQNHPEA